MTVVDQPAFVPLGDEALFAISSTADGPAPSGRGVLLLPAGGYTFTPQRNRWAVDFAHRLASAGYPTVRFDWQGIGDSTGSVDNFLLHQPGVAEAEAALSLLDADSHVLVGQCYGARTAMAMAGDMDTLAGVVLLSPPVRDFARGEGGASRRAYELSTLSYLKAGVAQFRPSHLTDRGQLERIGRLARTLARAKWRAATKRFRTPDPTPWVSKPFLDQLEVLIEAEVPTLLVYGAESSDYMEFEEARAGRLGDLLERGGSSVTIELIPGSLHDKLLPLKTAETIETQHQVRSGVEAWITSL